MSKGQDGSHDYSVGISKQVHDHPTSSSASPTWGIEGPANQGTFNSPEFNGSAAHARSGNPYTPSTPGSLGSNPQSSSDVDGQDYSAGSPNLTPRVMNGSRAYAWPDADGGQLGRS